VKDPMIGLTYCMEIMDSAVHENIYVCVLCEKKCDPRAMVYHFTSQIHRSNYIVSKKLENVESFYKKVEKIFIKDQENFRFKIHKNFRLKL
jgi:hypothetical protein